MLEIRRTTCNRDCPDACAIHAHVEDGKVIRIGGDPEHPITRGSLCYRTSRFLDTQYSPDRLTSPLLKKNGALVPVSWDEALDFVAAKLERIKAESGPASIFHYRSGGSLGVLKMLSDWFFELYGPVTIKRGDICSGAGDYAQMEDFGEEDSHDLFDLENARQIFIWGKNVVTSSPHTLPVLKRAQAKGCELTLIDPTHHKTVNHVDHFHSIKPGGDFGLAMAITQVLWAKGWTDPSAATYCDNLEAHRELAFSRSVESWCAEADVLPSLAEDLARRIGPGKPTAILVGWGMGRRIHGGMTVRALDALSAISGNLGIPGGGVSFYFKRRGAYDTSFIRGEAVAPRTICEPLFGAQIMEKHDPRIRAVWITAGNPVAMLPDSAANAEALATRELVVVVDSFLTDTAALATVVLPTTTLLEADDLLGAYGHHYLGVANPVVPPPPGIKSDLEIIQGLAARVGLGDRLAGDARSWKERFIASRLVPKGVDLSALETGYVRNPLPAQILFADRRFKTKSGKVNLLTDAPSGPEPLDPNFPLFLMSLSTEKSQSAQWAKPQVGPIVLTVHPWAANGIADGGRGRLISALGAIEVEVRHDRKQRKDVALLPKGGHFRAGRSANALIRARTTDFGEGGALYDERVRLEPDAIDPVLR